MKNILKVITAVVVLFMVYSCEPEDETMPLVQDESITESELLDLVDQSYFSNLNERNQRPGISFESVLDMVSGNFDEVGKSLLLRKPGKGLAMVLKAKGEPLTANTAWWIIFNNPENCTDGICGDDPDFADLINGEETGLAMLYASGSVSKKNGESVFVAYLKEGQLTEGVNGKLLGQPERVLAEGNAGHAQVNLVVRSHGPAIPGQIMEQIGSHGGGCVTDFPPFSQIPVNEGECADIQASVHIAG
ncbi:MAG: hypothetical protein DHS20C17_06390 [Cyclobacteriaceae bacterium]|nr:MAG: hypothetical protein DHS20C17_06390 [Cyclobacteriaceae bacterium]